MKGIFPIVLALFLIACTLTNFNGTPEPQTPGRLYYVSLSGSDSNNGLSPESAWQTIERVNAGNYQPGDRILFEGGQTFDGILQFTPQNWRGTAEALITVSSYGRPGERATLTGGIALAGVSGAAIEEVDFRAAKINADAAIFIFNQDPATVSGFRLVDVDISGFAYAFLAMTGAAPARIEDVYLERVSAHDNAAGPTFFGVLDQSGEVTGHYGIGDVYIGRSEFFNNTGLNQYNLGYGVTLMNAERVLIEQNAIHDNGSDNLPPGESPNGPSAITVYDGHNVTIQHNEIWHQRRDPDGPTDNGGIDIWATDSLVQYNYIHDNEGWGIILGAGDPGNPDEVFPWPNERNTIRYNIFENNARRLADSPIPEELGAELLMFGPVKDFEIYNNTFYARNPAAGAPLPEEGEQGLIAIFAVPPYRDPEGLRFRNNILIAEDRVRFIELSSGGARFENNAYSGGAAARQVIWGEGTTFDSIAAWSEATGQERVGGEFVARLSGPDALCAPGTGRAQGYRLAPNSPLIDAGADLLALGIPPGFTDFFGNPVPYPVLNNARSAFDIGAHEWSDDGGCPLPAD